MTKLTGLIEEHSPLFLQICRFGIVGLIATAIHFCTVITIVQHAMIAPLIANVFGFMVSFQVSYWGHRLWTFNDTRAVHGVALPKLLTVQLINFAANETLFYIFLSLNIPYPVALLIVLTILPIFTFVSSKMWVFR